MRPLRSSSSRVADDFEIRARAWCRSCGKTREMSREEAMAKYRARVPLWQTNPDLIHKAFLYDEQTRRGGGVYLWKNIEAAKKAHGPAFQEAIQSIFGSKPEMQYFEAPIGM